MSPFIRKLYIKVYTKVLNFFGEKYFIILTALLTRR